MNTLLITAIVFLAGINIVALFESWRLQDEEKKIKKQLKGKDNGN